MTEPESVGRNEPCPCGSGKKYKRCHGVNAAPKLTPPKQPAPGGLDPAALGNYDPQMMLQFSQALQRLPKGQMQRLQAIMQKAMSGKDVSTEAEEFEKTLPVDFQSMIQAMSLSAGGAPGAIGSSDESSDLRASIPSMDSGDSGESESMTEEQARALVARAAAEGKISSEKAQSLLENGPSEEEGLSEEPASHEDPLNKDQTGFRKLWRGMSGKK